MSEQETVWVRCAKPDGTVCLWDVHPDHPGGEVFVAGDTAAEAAMTPGVATALGQGRIVKTSAPSKDKRPVAADASAPAQPAADANDVSAVLGDELGAKLAEAGYATPAALMGANDEQLLAVPGVGKATLEKIREQYPQIVTD